VSRRWVLSDSSRKQLCTYRGAESPSSVNMTSGGGADGDTALPSRITVSPLMTDLTRATPILGRMRGADVAVVAAACAGVVAAIAPLMAEEESAVSVDMFGRKRKCST
jgi:hypothetical protein